MASLVIACLNSRPLFEFMVPRMTFPMEMVQTLDLRSSLWKKQIYCQTGSVKRRKTGSEVIEGREGRGIIHLSIKTGQLHCSEKKERHFMDFPMEGQHQMSPPTVIMLVFCQMIF